MIPDSEIPKCSEFEVKSKTRKIFKNVISLKNILLGFMKLILIFINIMKKIQVDKNGCKKNLELMFILINFYQQQELMKKDIFTEILFLRKKDRKHQKKNLVANLLETVVNYTSNAKNGSDLDYVGNIEAFIDDLKNKKIKKTRRKNKRKRRKIKQKHKRTRSQTKRTRRQK